MDEWIDADEKSRLPGPKQEPMDDGLLLLSPSQGVDGTQELEVGPQRINGLNASVTVETISTGAEDMDEGE